MYAIGTHDEASSKTRYLRDDSRGDTLWQTVDPARAIAFGSIVEAEAWAFSLAEAMTDRILSRRFSYIDLDTGERFPIADPVVPAWIDEPEESVSAGVYLDSIGYDPGAAAAPPVESAKPRKPRRNDEPTLI